MADYTAEFPDFPPADMPQIPAGFADQSWRNDACPSFVNAALAASVWIDYADAEKREFPESKRFSLHRVEIDGEGQPGATLAVLAVSDSWPDILAAIADRADDAAETLQTAANHSTDEAARLQSEADAMRAYAAALQEQ